MVRMKEFFRSKMASSYSFILTILKSCYFSFFLKIICFVAVERFCHHETEGFRLRKIASPLLYDARWDVAPLAADEQKAVDEILDQPFTFLGSGGQCYAFLSQDKTTVIKFFKHHHMRPKSWLNYLPFSPFRKIVDARKKRFEQIFGSCKIAYDDFKAETGLIYLHLNKTDHFHKKLILVDKLGIQHPIDLDKTEFALQTRADLAYGTLHHFMRKGDTESAKACLDSLLELIVTRSKRGIADKDPIIKRNFGFIGTRAVEIDLGSFTRDPYLAKPYYYKRELFYETVKLKRWIHKRYPELDEPLRERLYAHLSAD
jgi:hypothetical protein